MDETSKQFIGGVLLGSGIIGVRRTVGSTVSNSYVMRDTRRDGNVRSD